MNAKITFVELVDLMAKATSTTKRVCELFLKDLFAVVSQALIDGDNVTVKGVGTFKITRVKPRKSKVTFTPDKSLAEAVNQPFAQFETVVLDDAVTDEKLDEIDKLHPSAVTPASQAEVSEKPASVSLEPATPAQPESESQVEEETIYGEPEIPLAPLPFELPQMQDAAPAPTPDLLFESPDHDGEEVVAEKYESPVKEELVKAEPVKEKPIKKDIPQPKQEDKQPERKPMLVGRPIDGPTQPVPEQEKEEEVNTDRHFYRPEPRNVYTPTPEQIEEATRKPDRRWLWLLLSALAIVLIFWMMARSCDDSGQADVPEQEVVAADTVSEDSLTEEAKTVAEAKAAADKSEQKIEEKIKQEVDKADKIDKAAEKKEAAKPEQKPATTTKPSSKEVTDVVTSQIVLTTLSEKHYGSPWFWVYIYEENVARGTINDPNNIKPGTRVVIPPPGTRVVIPPADKYGINPNDKASLKKAQIKSMEYLKGR